MESCPQKSVSWGTEMCENERQEGQRGISSLSDKKNKSHKRLLTKALPIANYSLSNLCTFTMPDTITDNSYCKRNTSLSRTTYIPRETC